MNKFNNGLSEAQRERIALLIEECGEIIQIAGKILRHGFDSFNPFDPEQTKNRHLLEKEMGDYDAIKALLLSEDDLTSSGIHNAKLEKMARADIYLHFNSFRRVSQ